MNRRLLAAVVAVLIAAAGAWVILGYVRGADARAQAAESLTSVLVVTTEVPSGTAVTDLGPAVATQQVPTRLVDGGMLTDLTSVSGLVTTSTLLPGDLLQSARFGNPDAVRADGSLPAPDGTEEVSVTLERQRAAGGTLAAGDLVGVFGTYATLNDGPDESFRLGGVVVTRVAAPADPDGVYTVTLALDDTSAGYVTAAQSAGTVWLTLQAAGTSPSTQLVDGPSAGSSTDESSSGSTSGSASTGDNS